ncbi:MAG: gamma-glutamyl-gamma-aminobutyrate hydrolase family protein [Cardiobacteriaceae bacterium]|nr:gamma-glutamyl-gamma-aminobutyrate hydrolase family protein [Cardiobacteriaceae bacterium]
MNPNSKRIAIILHNPQGHTGMIGEYFAKNGHHQMKKYCPLAGCVLPDLETFDAAVVFGGNMSVNDNLPALQLELEWIRAVVEAGKPYLGICLGAQLLARAFGGIVTRHPEHYVEIGYFPVYPTIDGYNTIFQTAPERFYQWHNEGFTLPDNAIKLASSDLYPNQAFRMGESAFAFQFHPEAHEAQMNTWFERSAEQLQNAGAQTVEAQVRYREELLEPTRVWLEDFLERWLEGEANQKL